MTGTLFHRRKLEIFFAGQTLAFGLWLMMPFDAMTAPGFRYVVEAIPEHQWGSLFFFNGLCHMLASGERPSVVVAVRQVVRGHGLDAGLCFALCLLRRRGLEDDGRHQLRDPLGWGCDVPLDGLAGRSDRLEDPGCNRSSRLTTSPGF